MKSVIIISERPIDLATLAGAFKGAGRIDCQPGHRFVVEGDWGWFALEEDQSLATDFDPSEMEQVRHSVGAPHFTQLTYDNTQAANLAIKLLPEMGTILIDNDYGLLAKIQEIRLRIQAGSPWQAVAR